MSRDVMTGEERGWQYYTVTDVEEPRLDRIFCRRATIVGEDGREWRPFVQDILSRYEAVENVVRLPTTTDREEER